ncbi:hypothetical protein M0813_19303 [Anaeramoeba flamelloides]|uniref:Uncharacterized protein n=1 Tax=Anaeramoeba flamelloides TaxID=1746091 RepID=A0AAV7ZIW4_9EUKA|nr:hypothetical protein M0812_13206 [Anaeramoeba flamelloides]KAJ6246404.1 hypothetical protein M0813_19303 [Anaeramoeba flamelloides]
MKNPFVTLYNRIKNLERIHKLYLFCVLIESIILIITQLVGVTNYSQKREIVSRQTLIFYSILFALSVAFGFFFAVRIVVSRNMYQYVTFTICALLLTGYAIYEIATLYKNPRIIVLFSVIIVFDVIYLFLLKRMLKSFRFAFFSISGGSHLMKSLYRIWSIIVSQMQLDIMVNVVLLCALAFYSSKESDVYFWINLLVVILDIASIVIGYLGIKREHKNMTKFFLIIVFLQPIYYLLQVILIWTKEKQDTTTPLTIMIFFGIIIRIILIIFGIKAYKNFGKGLKYRLSSEYVSSGWFTTSQSGRVQDGLLDQNTESETDKKADVSTETDDEDDESDKSKSSSSSPSSSIQTSD